MVHLKLPVVRRLSLLTLSLLMLLAGGCHFGLSADVPSKSELKFETVQLTNGDAPITVNLAFHTATVPQHPVILMLGSLQSNQLPAWSTNLVNEGYMLAAFTAAYPPDPDPARRPQWLYFDQRFAHSYVLGGHRAANDAGIVMKYLAQRDDVSPKKIGWLGSSSTGIPGLFVTTQGPRLAAIVAFVSTGDCGAWFDTWHSNGLWRGDTNGLWPETEELLRQYDPVLHATNAFPTAVLMVNGGVDKVVDPRTARSFVDAARPAYQSDPERLRLVVYEGFGHNLPADVVQMHAENWFHLYMNPSRPAPRSENLATNLQESVTRSQINATDHRQIVGAVEAPPLEKLRIARDGHSFVTASGKPFVPWGFNYDRDYKSRLLEDYWSKEWDTVAADFRAMKKLGANVVRIHLQLGHFMDGPDQPNEHSLQQLDRLVQLAEDARVYLDLTGLGCYRKSDVPAWYSSLGEKDRWTVQARFWSAIAQHCAHSPAIFCYDLMNEPIVPSGKAKSADWLTGKLGDFYYCQFIALDQAGRPRSQIVHYWVATLSRAIREHDSDHFITIGLLPFPGDEAFAPKKLATQLDYLSVHIYPTHGKLANDLATVRGFDVGKPIVIEEMFPMNCSSAELRDFIKQSHPPASGWISFFWGQTPDQLHGSTNFVDGITRDWLQVFEQSKP